VLVLNPVIAALVEPYCSRVRIVPWGMDAARFPWPVRSRRGKAEATDGIRGGRGSVRASVCEGGR
jgi:hypothetical protein